jgi:hypothetical protein
VATDIHLDHSHPQNFENYKRSFCHLFYYYFECWTIKTLARPPYFTCSSIVHQLLTIVAHFQVFFITTMDPIIISVTKKDHVANEEALIDRDSYLFDTEITISPISMSISNIYDKVGRCILFLEEVQATIVPYAVEIYFPFTEFIGWCDKQYSLEERVVVNKRGSEVFCRVESLSIRVSLGIPWSFSTIF